MADETTTDSAELAANNDEVKRKMAEQGAVNPNANEIDIRHSQDALDQLAAAKTKDNQDEPEIEPKPEGTPPPPALDDEAAKKKAEDDAKAAEAKKAADAEFLKRSEDIFKDTPSLPQGASPKSTEAFSSIKIRAAQEIASRDAELEKVRKENEELKARVDSAKPLTPEVEKEIEDLRNFRNRLDVEADPKFKEFNKQVSSAQEFIYAQLKKSPAVSDATIEEIKKYGGPEMVNLTKLFEKVNDPTLQRLVEAKIADIEQAKWAREEAIKSAKANIGQYVAEREKAATQAATAHHEATKSELNNLRKVEGMAWLKPKEIDPKADEATKKEIEEHNAFIKQTEGYLVEALRDDSPMMRAIQIAGMGQLLYVQRLYEGLRAQHAGLVESNKKVLEAKDKEIVGLQEKIEAYKRAGTSRLRESNSPPGGKMPETKTGVDFRPAGDSLDALARQIAEQRQAAGR